VPISAASAMPAEVSSVLVLVCLVIDLPPFGPACCSKTAAGFRD
jgi:hypothetical protein